MSESSFEIQDNLGVLWGAEAIANFVNLPVERSYYLLQTGKIDADKIGDLWASTKARLRKQFGGENRFSPPAKAETEPTPKAKIKPALKRAVVGASS